MEAPNKRRDALACMTDDLILEILHHLLALSLFRCKLVCRCWDRIIKESNIPNKLAHQTVTGFFYDSMCYKRDFTSVTSVGHPSFELLSFNEEYVVTSDCCNGLILCWCLGPNECRYVVCNPMTKNYVTLPPSTHEVHHAGGEARLAFDPTASSHFHVIEYVDGEDFWCVGVEIYSSKTAAWIYKESEWGKYVYLIGCRSPSVFLNCCLHTMGYSVEGARIFAVDMEGNTWRTIDWPSGKQHSMHQANGHLCLCNVDGPNDSMLSIWILEDYGSNIWTLKHTVSTMKLFGNINIEFGVFGSLDKYTVLTVHPEWNFVFFVRKHSAIVAYDMDRRKVHVIPARVFPYCRHSIKRLFIWRPVYLPYVPLLSDSLAEQ